MYMNFFLSIESEGRPGTYRSVNVYPHRGMDDLAPLKFATGDFLADWQSAMQATNETALAHNADEIDFSFSSSVDHWVFDSCEWALDETGAGGWPSWTRLPSRERARRRGAAWMVHEQDDLAPYTMGAAS